MPPIEPPTTAYQRSMPRWSASAASTRDLVADRDRPGSATRTAGRSRDRSTTGPVVPWQPPSTLGHTTKKRSVSIARPGPIDARPTTRVAVPGPGRSGRVAVAGERVQHEHRVRRVGVERRPTSRTRRSTGVERAAGLAASSGRRSNSVANCRRPGRSPGRHAPVTGTARVTRHGSPLTRLRGAEPGVEVGEDVVERLDADRQPHEVGRDARGRLLVRRRAAVRRASPGGSRGCARRRRWRGG